MVMNQEEHILPPCDAMWLYSNIISEREWLPYGQLDYTVVSGITHLNSYDNLFNVYMAIATLKMMLFI